MCSYEEEYRLNQVAANVKASYDIKSEVLLGAIWNKIKLRMFSYYYICGKYILKNNKKIKKSNKFEEYIVHSSRNYETKKTHSNDLNDIDEILPSISRDSNNLNISRAINSSRTEKNSFIKVLL